MENKEFKKQHKNVQRAVKTQKRKRVFLIWYETVVVVMKETNFLMSS